VRSYKEREPGCLRVLLGGLTNLRVSMFRRCCEFALAEGKKNNPWGLQGVPFIVMLFIITVHLHK